MPVGLVVDDGGKIPHVKGLAASSATHLIGAAATSAPNPAADEQAKFPPGSGILHAGRKAVGMLEFRRGRSADLFVAVTILDILG